MSGGFFDINPKSISEEYKNEWGDRELNELFNDLFGNGYYNSNTQNKMEFGRTWADEYNTGGLAETLDLYKSGDISKEKYYEQVNRFKRKWLKRDDKDIRDFYINNIIGQIDGIKRAVLLELEAYHKPPLE